MSYILIGFSQQSNVRDFVFERIGRDGTRNRFNVHADLSLVREFNIKVQELPLLCLQLLDSQPATSDTFDLVLTADNMRAHADSIAAGLLRLAAKRPPRPHPELLKQSQ